MKKQLLIASCALMLIASPVAAQGDEQATPSSSSSSSSTQKESATQKANTTTTQRVFPNPFSKFVDTLTNVQIELTLTDQLGTQPPEKKMVSMIASSGNWGK